MNETIELVIDSLKVLSRRSKFYDNILGQVLKMSNTEKKIFLQNFKECKDILDVMIVIENGLMK